MVDVVTKSESKMEEMVTVTESDSRDGDGDSEGGLDPPKSEKMDAVFVDVEVDVEIQPMTKELKALAVLDRSLFKNSVLKIDPFIAIKILYLVERIQIAFLF